ncbi:Ig-like domain (group 3) [Amphibacillus marinus]|uniref:Ig-like domain (Group 3) n=1 Tax=Amphibacillus marinus TaxID=872970 RepID=A0A1H8R4U9_9BACI|nr:Ig-like domain-containing protein [Amphibacillus marinus]SEO61154.1 Ig-like domain (group 3) [Amphibacillus marinus]
MAELYQKKKKIFIFPTIAITLLFLIIFSSDAFSSSELQIKVTYDGIEWDARETFPFDQEWFTIDNQVKLTLDLSQYFDEDNERQEQPFSLTATFEGNTIEPDLLAPVGADQDEFQGLFEVRYSLPEEDGWLELSLNIAESNDWGIPSDQNPINLTIIKDTQAPVINISGVADGAVYYPDDRWWIGEDYPTVTVEIDDLYTSEGLLEVNVNGEGQSISRNGDSSTFSTEFTTDSDGIYHVEVLASDRAGHHREESLTFYINNDGPVLELSVDGEPIQSAAHVQSGDLYLVLENQAPIAAVALDITRDGAAYELTEGIVRDGTTATLSEALPDGFYQLDLAVEDAGGVTHELDQLSFTVDSTAPVIDLIDQQGEQVPDRSDEAIGRVTLEVADLNLDIDQTNVSIEREDLTGREAVRLSTREEDDRLNVLFNMNRSGVYHIEVEARDYAGNLTTYNQTVVVDFDQPTVRVTDEQGEDVTDVYFEPVVLTFTLADLTLDLDATDFSVQKQNPTTGEMEDFLTKTDLSTDGLYTSVTKALAEGYYQIDVTAVNQFGRETSYNGSVLVDEHDPIIELNSSIEQGAHINQTDIEELGFDQFLNIIIEEPHLDTKQLTMTRILADGSETIYAQDQLGQWLQAETDQKRYDFIVENNLWLEDGYYIIEIMAEDRAGRVSNDYFSFVVDDTAPVIEVSQLDRYYNEQAIAEIIVTEEHYQSNTVTVAIEKQDRDGHFQDYQHAFPEWRNDGSVTRATYLFDEDGTYRLSVSATDQAGNQANSAAKTFTINQSAPELIVDGVDDHRHYNHPRDVSITIGSPFLNLEQSSLTVEKWNEQSGVFESYHTDNEPVTTAQTITLAETFAAEGVYRLTLDGTDLAGNIAETKVVRFTIDKEAPVVGITGVDHGGFYSENQSLTLSVFEKYFPTNQVDLTMSRNGEDISDSVLNQIGPEWMHHGEQSSAVFETFRDGFYRVRLEAEDAAGNQAEAVETEFTIDSAFPSITVRGIEGDVHYEEDRLMEIEITDHDFDINRIEVTKDGEPYEVGEFEITRRIFRESIARLNYGFTEEGSYDVFIESIDRADNRSTESISFTIDKTAPVLSVGKQLDGEFVIAEFIRSEGINKLVPIELTELHIKEQTVRIEKTAPDSTTQGWTNDELGVWEHVDEETYQFVFTEDFYQADGDYTLTVSVEDYAGHSRKQSIRFVVDNTKPVIQLSDLARYNNQPVRQDIEVIENNYQTNDVTIRVYRRNRNGNYVRYDHQQLSNWRNSGRRSQLALDFDQDGTYRVVVDAIDAAGNVADTATQTFAVDQTAPTLSLTGVADGQYYNRNRPVTVRVTDDNLNPDRTNLAVYKLNYQSGEMERYRDVANVSFSDTSADWRHVFRTNDEGVFEIRLRATDRAGNTSEHETIRFTVDATAPVLQANQITDGTYYPSAQTAQFLVRERHFSSNTVNFEITRNGQTYTDTVEGNRGPGWRTSSFESRLNYRFDQDGAYTIAMEATDAAGNAASTVNKQFVIDTIRPVIEIEGVENGEYYNMDRPVTIRVRDVNLDQQTVSVTRDGVNYPLGNFSVNEQAYRESTATLSHTFTEEGDYQMIVNAVDKAGHQDQMEISFTVDKTAPEITPRMSVGGEIIEDGSYINRVFTPFFELDQPDVDTIDSVVLNGGSNIAGNVPTASEEMQYNYEVTASDRAGNVTTLNVSFTVDTTRPELDISGIIEGYFNESMTPIVTYSDLHLDEEGSTVTLNGDTFVNGTTLVDEQDYVLRASIADLAENVTERTIVFTIDKTAPIIRFTEPLSNQYFNDVVIPEFFIEDMTDYEIIALTLNGQPYELGQPIETEGKHVLYFEVVDRAGNIKQLTVEFIIDMTPPEFIIEGVEDEARYYENVSVDLTLLNDEDVIQSLTINGEDHLDELAEGSAQIRFTDPANYQISAQAYDLAGNETTLDLSFEIAEKTVFMKWYENRPLFAGSLIGLLALSGTGGAILYKKRRIDK